METAALKRRGRAPYVRMPSTETHTRRTVTRSEVSGHHSASPRIHSGEFRGLAARDCDSVSSTPGTRRGRWERVAAPAPCLCAGTGRIIRFRGQGVRRRARGRCCTIDLPRSPAPCTSGSNWRTAGSSIGANVGTPLTPPTASAGSGSTRLGCCLRYVACFRWSSKRLRTRVARAAQQPVTCSSSCSHGGGGDSSDPRTTPPRPPCDLGICAIRYLQVPSAKAFRRQEFLCQTPSSAFATQATAAFKDHCGRCTTCRSNRAASAAARMGSTALRPAPRETARHQHDHQPEFSSMSEHAFVGVCHRSTPHQNNASSRATSADNTRQARQEARSLMCRPEPTSAVPTLDRSARPREHLLHVLGWMRVFASSR